MCTYKLHESSAIPTNKRQLKGKAKRSLMIYEYGADLMYVHPNGKTQKELLCCICHLGRNKDCFVDGTSHNYRRLTRFHIRSDDVMRKVSLLPSLSYGGSGHSSGLESLGIGLPLNPVYSLALI
jgi:hypothetical protein